MRQFEPKMVERWHIIILLILVSGINFLYMPAFRITGDAEAIEYVSYRLIKYGSLSVPEEFAKNHGSRGQTYFENIIRHKWYSKYGIANTFIMTIPLYMEKVFIGDLQYDSEFRTLFLNLFNILLSIFLFFYIYHLSTLYKNRSWVNTAFSLSVLYCTYLSYYIRAQSAELYQILFFTSFFYHSIMVIRYARPKRIRVFNLQLNLHLILSLILLGMCCLIKEIYLLVLPGFLFILLKHLIKRRYNEKIKGISCSFSDIAFSLLFVMLLILFIGIINYYKFGSIFESGYGQWENEFDFSIKNILPHFISGLIHPQNSLIINFPIIILSLFGIKKYFYQYRQEALLIAVTVLPVYILIFSFGNWAGEFTYGPRYFLFALPVLGLPAIFLTEKINQFRQKAIRHIFYIIIILCGIFSAFIHHNTNSLRFFIPYHIRYVELSDVENLYINKYFDNVHFGLIAYDLIKFRDDGRKLKFLNDLVLEGEMHPSEIQNIESQILKKLDPNFYWFSGKSFS